MQKAKAAAQGHFYGADPPGRAGGEALWGGESRMADETHHRRGGPRIARGIHPQNFGFPLEFRLSLITALRLSTLDGLCRLA